MSDIQTVALGKGQLRITTTVEKDDGTTFTKVEIQEVDRDAGMGSTGLRTVRQEIVNRG